MLVRTYSNGTSHSLPDRVEINSSPLERSLASATRVESEYYTWPSNSILRYIPYVQRDILTKLFIAHFFSTKDPKISISRKMKKQNVVWSHNGMVYNSEH